MPTPKPFPAVKLNYEDSDANPGIQLFGRRFFSDQTIMEYLVEFLLVSNSPKCFAKSNSLFHSCLPGWDQLQTWYAEELGYVPPARLALKLFSFIGASKLETRHNSHRQQYSVLLENLRQSIQTDGTIEKEDVLQGLENLLLGFQGAGSSRTWCAQVFVPLSSSLLASETIWQQSKANRNGVSDWSEALKYFSNTQQLFMARGGELLYLQLCNAFRSRGTLFEEFVEPLDLTAEERNPRSLYDALQHNLRQITRHAPPAIDRIAVLIDEIDDFTAKKTNRNEQEPIRCGWCPEQSWQEGYLFAVEINRLCIAAIDPIERIELLMLGCAMQVLRSLCAQSARYANTAAGQSTCGGGLGYAWIVSDPEGNERGLKHLSQRNLQVIQRVIQQALRDKDIQENADKHRTKGKESLSDEADKRYGHKLFLSLAKKLGFVVPQRGPGARFVFNDKIVRYLVLALVPPGERKTYDDFKSTLYAHYGIALEGKELKLATAWSDLPQLHSSGTEAGAWLADMLKASGFLIHLSDACSLVHNPFSVAASQDT